MANTKLPARLLDTSAIPALNVTGDLTVDTTTLRVDSTNNRVGIGTASPDSPLEISGSDDTRLKITDTGDSCELILRSDGPNTQIYTNTAHDLGIYTHGNQGQLHLKQSNGNVGIGDTSPDTKLHVLGNVKVGSAASSTWATSIQDAGGLDVVVGSGATGFRVWDDNSQSTPRFIVTRAGNVGIGTSSPAHPFHITKELAGYQAYFNNDNGSAQGIKVRIKSNDSGNFNMLELVSASTGSDVTAMVVRDDGKVGIGNDAPSEALGISYAAHGLYSQHRPSANVGTGQEMYYKFNTADGTPEIFSSIYSEIESSTDGAESGKIALRAAKAGNLTTGLILIGSTGNVGVGTNTPQAKLAVNTPLTQANADLRAIDIVVPGSWSLSGNAGRTSDITWTNSTGSGAIMGRFGLRYSGTATNGGSEWVFKDMYQGGYAASGDIMFIGSNGIVLTPKQPAFRVDQTGVSGLSTGSYTVSFSEPSGTSFDIGNNFSGDVFTAPVAGTYHFSTSCRVDGAGVPYFRILISKNSSVDSNTNLHSIYGTPAATYENLQVSGNLYLAQGDTARVIIMSSSDTSWSSQGEGHFSGHLIG